MHARAATYVGDVTMSHVGHAEPFKDPRWLCILPENLSVPV